jgi:hypothetical protein
MEASVSTCDRVFDMPRVESGDDKRNRRQSAESARKTSS